MEYEVRYYYPTEKLENIIKKIKSIKELKMGSRCYEKTSQFDHPNSEMSFYSKEIDGRFRIRVTKSDEIAKCKISWKRRIPTTKTTDVNQEEEVELSIKYDEYDNLMSEFKEDNLSETFLQQVLYLVKNITDNKVKNCL